MLKNLTIQKRFTILALIPMIIIAVVALGALRFIDDLSDVRVFGIFALIGLVITGIAAAVLSQSIGRTLTETADAARKLARAQEAVLIGDEQPLENLAPLPTPAGELGELHSALNSVQDGSRKVIASQRGAVKEGLATIVVDLARRNQSLLDRQVEFIEALEHNEEDPDKLENLFTVDHLATRMRRNAESLLVLAEAEPGKRRGGPVDATDVIRVAIGEIENYQHINLGTIAPGRLSPTHAIDLAHLLAELMENATQSSPPETAVEVYSDEVDEAYVVSVVDYGMGMTEDQMADSNRTLEDPPELGLSMTRSLGFVVVGRLAERLGASVQLYPSANTGVTAEIVLPKSILLPPSDGSTDTSEASKVQFNKGASAVQRPGSDQTGGVAADSSSQSDSTDQNSPALARLLGLGADTLPETETATAPEDWSERSPFEDASRSSTSKGSAKEGQGSALPARAKKPAEPSETAAPVSAASWTPPPVTPNAPSMTSRLSEALPSGGALEAGMDSLLETPPAGTSTPASGLAKRKRTESQAPESEGRTVPESGRPMAVANHRKPEEIRSMLLQYRAGLKGERPSESGSEAAEEAKETTSAQMTEQDPS